MDDGDEARLCACIEREFGGRVVSCERQARWRPAWFVQLERGDQRLPIYFRGDRGIADHGAYTLEHEMKILQVLASSGIPVPAVHVIHWGAQHHANDRRDFICLANVG